MMVTILPVLRYWIDVLEDGFEAPTRATSWPVGIGSSLPTWIRAGRLSVASTLGEERILIRESVANALIKARTLLLRPMIPLIPLPKGVKAARGAPLASVGTCGRIPLRTAPPE